MKAQSGCIYLSLGWKRVKEVFPGGKGVPHTLTEHLFCAEHGSGLREQHKIVSALTELPS